MWVKSRNDPAAAEAANLPVSNGGVAAAVDIHFAQALGLSVAFTPDLDLILDVVERTDPSFAAVDPPVLNAHIEDARRHASEPAHEQFLLSVMGLLALPRNGHTRLIPNDAISVLPLRFVTRGRAVYLTRTSPALSGCAPAKLLAVNGTAVAEIERAAAGLLAGTWQRQRAIGPLLFAWPAALDDLGYGSGRGQTRYRLQSADGRIRDMDIDHGDAVLASDFYPGNEHGHEDPDGHFNGFADVHDYAEHGFALRLPSFFDPGRQAFPEAMETTAAYVRARPRDFALIDVRGNTGGDFLLTLPLIEALTDSARHKGRAVVVDKFTFSAAIVFVALLKHRLGRKLTIIGEGMGDGLRFYAEGGMIPLPNSGAILRHATALHDWETGTVDKTTPPDIADHIVPVGSLDIDQDWVSTPFDATPPERAYEKLLKNMA